MISLTTVAAICVAYEQAQLLVEPLKKYSLKGNRLNYQLLLGKGATTNRLQSGELWNLLSRKIEIKVVFNNNYYCCFLSALDT